MTRGYAPVARITTAPDPADTGTELIVGGDLGNASGATGDRFPPVPWTGLIWPSQSIPHLGENAEEVTVTAIDGDEVTIARGTPSIEIAAGMQLAVLALYPKHNYASDITFRAVFEEDEPPYVITITDPEGYVNAYTADDETGGTASYLFEDISPGGHWTYFWMGSITRAPKQHFFVEFE